MYVPITDIENQPKFNYYELTFWRVIVVVSWQSFLGHTLVSALFRPRGWLEPVKSS